MMKVFLLLEHVLTPFHDPGRQADEQGQNHRQTDQAREQAWTFPEDSLNQADRVVVRHGMGNETLDVIRDRESLQVAWKRQGRLLPTEDEDEPDEQRALELCSDKGEERPVHREPQRE